MADSRTPTRAVLPVVLSLLTTSGEAACGQARVARRLVELTLGLVLAFGRHTVTRMLVTIGQGDVDWSAAYRLFRHQRVDLEVLRRQLLRRLVPGPVTTRPLTVVLDSTQLPRSSARLVGVGWLKAPRTPPWKPGIHRAQRWVGLSVLLPRSVRGESRAVPLWFFPAPSSSARPWPGQPPCKEWEAGLAALRWLRSALTAIGQARRPVLAVADGSYGVAPLWKALPPHVTLLARCAKTRALFALPTPPAVSQRGRRRKYGERGPTRRISSRSPANGRAAPGRRSRSWCAVAPSRYGSASPVPGSSNRPQPSRSTCSSSPGSRSSIGGDGCGATPPSGWFQRRGTGPVPGSCRIRRPTSWPGPGNAGKSRSCTASSRAGWAWASSRPGTRWRP